ncbi:Isoquinoline 1-oxidoreductase subunit beta [Flammeovirgaceae bacterium 311]|nr:Isoquinoline 1-oxidoreductase subunit beta [Flammeovirgaceae bacterium 311]
MNRRNFLKISSLVASGWLLAELVPVKAMLGLEETLPSCFEPHPLIKLCDDGKVVLYVMKQEMGQSVNRSLPLILAEELEVNPDDVVIENLPYNPTSGGDYNTWGSMSVRTGWLPLRTAGATARIMLIAAAAADWNVPAEECKAENSTIVHPGSGKSVPYSKLIDKASSMPVPQNPVLKDPKDFKLLGKGQKKLNIKQTLTGKTIYSFDVKLPGMLYATVVRCPVSNGKVKSWDDTALKEFDNSLQVVPVQAMGGGIDNRNGLAIVANNSWLALRGQQLLKVEWELGPHGATNTESLYQQLKEAISTTQPTDMYNAEGKAESFQPLNNSKAYTARYELPYLAHAAMEPVCCTAQHKDGKWDLWGGFQAPGLIADHLPKAFGIEKEALFVNLLQMGGAFGRKEKLDNAAEAMQLAKALNKPVKVFFSRADDTRMDFYRPASYHEISAVADRNSIKDWTHQQSITTWPDKNISGVHDGFGGAMGDLYYPTQSYSSAFYPVASPLPIGSWRSISYHHNVFVIESFIDELAQQQGIDPIQFRLNILKQPMPDGPIKDAFNPKRLETVLQKCAEAIGWSQKSADGHYKGIACCNYTHAQAYAAHAFEISISPENTLQIHKAVCVLDCGTIIDPDGLKAQIEGSLVWGLSAAIKEEVTVNQGAVVQQSYFDFDVMRMGEMPPFEIILIPSQEAPGGAGETAVPSIAPALTNALAAATGKRIRTLPVLKEGFKLV